MLKIIGVVVGVCASSMQALAETRAEEAVRLSKLTLSAMECALLATNGDDGQRLGEVGLAAGKKFLEVIPKLNADEQKLAYPNIALLWRGVPGHSTDFVLGRVWQEMETIVYRSLGEDTTKWEQEKRRKYGEKNCMIIR